MTSPLPGMGSVESTCMDGLVFGSVGFMFLRNGNVPGSRFKCVRKPSQMVVSLAYINPTFQKRPQAHNGDRKGSGCCRFHMTLKN